MKTNYTFQKNNQLVDFLVKSKKVTKTSIIEALRLIDRKSFVGNSNEDLCYQDIPLNIGYGQTISQPSTVCFMLELLQPNEGDHILDIGSGSGWTTALLAYIAGPNGKVIGIERIKELMEFGEYNFEPYDYFDNATIIPAKPNELGLPGQKFDRILVSTSTKYFPKKLLKQLKPGGCMVLPVGKSIYQVTRGFNSRLKYKKFPGYIFVPLYT
jgi:protein-L-isoaspartate(D-aspartate) O-methyltransferase